MDNNDFSDITKESSFWKLYLACRKIPSNKDNAIVSLLSFLLSMLIIYCCNYTSNELIKSINEASINITTWSVGIIGFILAGYAIFATLAQPDMQMKMALIKSDVNELSFLKLIHYSFIKCIIDMLFIIFVCFVFSIDFVSKILYQMRDIYIMGVDVKTYFLVFILAMIYSLFVLLLMLTKSFVYNVCHSVMTSIRWYAENHVNESTSKDDE